MSRILAKLKTAALQKAPPPQENERAKSPIRKNIWNIYATKDLYLEYIKKSHDC